MYTFHPAGGIPDYFVVSLILFHLLLPSNHDKVFCLVAVQPDQMFMRYYFLDAPYNVTHELVTSHNSTGYEITDVGLYVSHLFNRCGIQTQEFGFQFISMGEWGVRVLGGVGGGCVSIVTVRARYS